MEFDVDSLIFPVYNLLCLNYCIGNVITNNNAVHNVT